MSRRHLAVVLAVSGLLIAGFTLPSHAQQPQSCRIGSTVILGVNSADLNAGLAVITGDVVVNNAFTGSTLVNGFSLSIGQQSSVVGSIAADRIKLSQQTTISGTASFNQLSNGGATLGGQSTPLALPVFSVLPPFQEAIFRGSPANVSVASGETRVLAAGEYGDVVVAASGKVVFTGGVYTLRSVDAGQSAILTFSAAADVRIANKFHTGKNSTIGPATGSGLTAANIVFYVGGINGANGLLNSTPPAAQIEKDSTVSANFYVANGTLKLDQGLSASGAFIARDVKLEQQGQVGVQSAFVNRSPTANTQTVTTNGLEPLIITLTALDPENSDMVFAIQGSGIQFPARGSLSGVSQAPAPFPGNPPGCTSETPCVTPPDPPRTSATVTYTPITAEENSFTFSATDACGNVGTAVVHINPPPDQGQPPVTTVVDATDIVVETPTDTPRSVVLLAGAPLLATLTFSVESLPAHGTLKDSSGVTIESVPYALPSRKVIYVPATGFTGLDTFLFKATGTSGGFDTATVSVNVLPRSELALDQSLTTNLNVPIEVTLQGNPGGAGTAVEADARQRLLAQTQAVVLTGATIAGNVSDANADGLGDGRDSLPGPAPVLVAAGVDVNLGSPSGIVTDPDNDASPSSNPDPDPDVVSATVSSDGTNLYLQVRFKAGTFDPLLTRAQFILDTDQNPATGHPGSNAGCVDDAGIIGAEYLVNLGANLGTTAQVLAYGGTCNSFFSAGSGTTTFVTDGMNATVPLSVLGNDDGRVNFKVAISEQVSESGFTGVLDYMPDLGLAAGESRTGIQGVARIQIEWNVSSIPSTDVIESAEVTLSTLKGTVDILDTSFFAGTAEQDGLLAVSDFQAPADPISGVVMPVPAGPTNTEGTFVFDVTSQLKTARALGRNFFSIQGRVNEGLAGGGFKRGLQVRSTADGNISAGKEPKLNVVTTSADAPLTFTVTSLPLHGTLTFAGSLVSVNQTFTTPPTLLYTPNLAFTGTETFAYRVTQGAVSDLALVSIAVLFNETCVANGRDPGCFPH